MRSSFRLLAALMLGAPAAVPAQQRRPITQTDLYAFKWVADPQISPDGRQVAYVLVAVNEKKNGYVTSIWVVPADGSSPARRLTAGLHDAAPRWSPDSHSLAFVRSLPEKPPQIFLLTLAGGEGIALTDVDKGASAPVWSPDGKSIAFTSSTEPGDGKDSASRKDSAAKDDAKSDVHVITRAVFRANGAGFIDYTEHSRVWVVPVDQNETRPAKARQITTGDIDAGELVWSQDGSRIFFSTDTAKEGYYKAPDANVYAVPAAGGALEKVVDIDGPVFGAVPSPNGKSFAFAGFINPAKVRSYDEIDLFVLENGKALNLAADYGFDIGGGIGGDQHAPRAGGNTPLVWSADGKSVYVVTSEQGAANLMRFDVATGKVDSMTTGSHEVAAYSASADASRFALSISDDTHMGDVYLLETPTKKLTQLTHVNDSLFSQLQLSAAEPFWYRSFDGQRVQGWVMKPVGFVASKKYPMILEIHGGPHSAYGAAFTHEFQWMAAKGYVVLFTNPRGSTSYGQAFGNVIQYRYPGDDYKDLMVAVDTIIKRGYVDAKKLGITGGSGGGLLTNWAVTQTDRFAAAVSQRSVADWMGFWFTTDFTLFSPSWFRATPWEDPTEYARRSPVTYAAKIHTPMMFVDGEADFRAPPTQGGEAMFRSLKALHKPTVLVLFPRESHELSRSGEPKHRVERLQHILNWFDKYLMGAAIADYDVK